MTLILYKKKVIRVSKTKGISREINITHKVIGNCDDVTIERPNERGTVRVKESGTFSRQSTYITE